MSLSTKILVVIGAVVALFIAAFIIYKQVELSNRQTAIETQVVKQKDLADNITRSLTEYASKKDIEKFIKDNGVNLKAIQDDMSLLHAEIRAINTAVVKSKGSVGENVPTDHNGPVNPNPPQQTLTVDCNGKKIPCPNPDTYNYLAARQELKLYEEFENIKVPLGEVGFSAWQKNPWNFNILPRDYRVTSVVGVDENQRQYFYNKFSIRTEGKDYDLHIADAVTKQEYPEAKFSFWNPRLFLGIDGGFNLTETKGEFSPNINIGLMSYGMYKTQPDFTVLQLGIGYGSVSNKVQMVITPFAYNIGKHIPLMNNMYVGPSVYLGTNGDVAIMGGIRTAL